MHPIHFVQQQLDKIAMYRVVTLALVTLVVFSLFFGVVGLSPYSFTEQLVSLVVAVGLALLLNVVFATIWRVAANHESALITALIIFFLVIPGFSLTDQWHVAAVTAIAIASKFVIVWKRQHIFNAAAFGAVALSLPGVAESAWWVGSPELFLPLLVVGTAVVMKIRKWTPVLSFLAAAFIVYVFEAWRLELGVLDSIPVFFTSWPALFLAFFMLTEPFTLPGTKKMQALYGALVGGLSSAAFLSPLITMSPELALVIGNLVFWPLTLQQKLRLTLRESKEIAQNTFEFVFEKPAGMQFQPGQYLEWMLPHKNADNRGLRRYFTIASAPHEPELRLGVRVAAEEGSTYKRALAALKPGDQIIASQRAGDFLLPSNKEKLAFVAGGIGVTPFRSHLAHLAELPERHDVTLFYCNNTEAEIAYHDLFNELAQSDDFSLVNVLAKEEKAGFEHGYLDKDIIERHVPDYRERTWYLSGPPGMVNAYTKLLRELGISKQKIVQDFFPGLA